MNWKIIAAFLLLVLLGTAGYVLFFSPGGGGWTIDGVRFEARDGFPLDAYLIRPRSGGKKYPAVACFHQLWGNRDDFLKLFPWLARAGIVVLAPDFPRQQPTYEPTRISDLRDSIDYLETLECVDPERLGIITASFSVETGMTAIGDKPNVIGSVMISGQILRENSRKNLTLHSNLAIFTISSIFDGSHYLMMKEYLGRSLNPHSRSLFIKKQTDPFSIHAHGTFVFDEVPDSLKKIQAFFMDVFGIASPEGGDIKRKMPDHAVYFPSTDGLPVVATFRLPRTGKRPCPAVILYPPQFKNRRYYTVLTERLLQKGIASLVPNTKRTCRAPDTLHLCDKEIQGAIRYLLRDDRIDDRRLAVVFPSFYYLAAKKMVENGEIPVKMVVFMEAGPKNYGIRPKKVRHEGYDFHYLDKPSLGKLKFILMKRL